MWIYCPTDLLKKNYTNINKRVYGGYNPWFDVINHPRSRYKLNYIYIPACCCR